jgi:hypothetical protein
MPAPAMMSSVIPARLEFQCGHAALVSLPRVKGESPAQRTDRIAREKSAAQARSCDFCPPRLEVVEVAQAVVVVAAQPAPAPAPVVLHVAPVALPAPPIALPVPPIALPVPPIALPVPPIALPVALVAARTEVAPTTTRRITRPRRKPAPAAPPVAPARNGRATRYRFIVHFRTEAVLKATDIRDALRQAESLGATEVLALARNA